MTPPIDDPATLRRILANTEALLLDFDGPICSVFSGMPAPVVADQLRAILAEGGHTNLPADIAAATDPFDILFYAATLGPNEARFVEAAFRAHEVEAVQRAQPTPGTDSVLDSWRRTGHAVAVVSNNSRHSVDTYFTMSSRSYRPDVVSARLSADVALLKPSPYLIERALSELDASPSLATLIGDSPSDVLAAKEAGVRCIAYANRPDKLRLLTAASPVAILTSMTILAATINGETGGMD